MRIRRSPKQIGLLIAAFFAPSIVALLWVMVTHRNQPPTEPQTVVELASTPVPVVEATPTPVPTPAPEPVESTPTPTPFKPFYFGVDGVLRNTPVAEVQVTLHLDKLLVDELFAGRPKGFLAPLDEPPVDVGPLPKVPRKVSDRVHIYDAIILEASKAASVNGHAVPPALIKAHALVESGMNPYALSPMGAMGVMQFIAETAATMGVPNALGDPDIFLEDSAGNLFYQETKIRSLLRKGDLPLSAARAYWVRRYRDRVVSGVWLPEHAFPAGAKYIAYLHQRFAGKANALDIGIAAYNCGDNNVVKAGYRVPDFEETQYYVPRVKAWYKKFLYQMPIAGAPPPPQPGEPFYIAP